MVFNDMGIIQSNKDLNMNRDDSRKKGFAYKELSDREKLAVKRLTTPRKMNRYCPYCNELCESGSFYRFGHHEGHSRYNSSNKDSYTNKSAFTNFLKKGQCK